MKKSVLLFLVGFIGINSAFYAQSRIPTFELHGSANHPLSNNSEDRTFFGGGFGANLIFRDRKLLSFKTGIETNFFHTWNKSVSLGKMSGKSDVHYKFWNLSIPILLRLHVGQKVKFFLEGGVYLGIPLIGNTTSEYHSYSYFPGGTNVNEPRTEKFEGYFSVSPAASLGVIFPVSQRIDLYLKPEFLFQKNFDVNVYGPGSDFNSHFLYFRLCFGIRINLNNEIE
ncbi:hypothetical protein [Fluviicola taffensis]|uniref:Outer membrane protein beta-barrel domain-containing protein n=1 Tax=Fluviicola taffensis (strain DSM 16823 / NCIMB 13979 / RW262) TaxID=755732 RepID=F2IJT3_FLUTR|nr:hypothetical protein [Fluviicola taffensis]AEA43973.1 hypothetical protein Fluta_1987 [Fluviicola taffensis DSM 16823]